ncbi:HXXEE domain-containing protein [Pelagibacteraceae bacterium]|nr:HXXEE domain-containing protein [Pelagibacteraceae bacterium]
MLKFQNLIVLSPLIYAIHHFEEHVLYNFREWRLKYFSDNNAISTETILIILSSILLIFIFFHLIKNNRASAHLVLFFLMTTQVVNALFHIFFSFYFKDFSPGAITGTLLYLPVNFLIIQAAFTEGHIRSIIELCIISFISIGTFALFEIIGPIIIGISIIFSILYYFIFKNKLT